MRMFSDAIRVYQNLLEDLQGSEEQGFRLLQNLLHDKASSFSDSIRHFCLDLDYTVTKMKVKFNSATRQSAAL
jgi:hypothetical protein